MLLAISSITLVVLLILLAAIRYIWATKNSRKLALKGIDGLKQLIELTKLTQQHRGMHAGFLNGRKEFSDKLLVLEANIQSRIDELVKFEALYSPSQSLGIKHIQTKWQRICDNKQQSSAESFQSHSGLIARMLDSLWDIADHFALTSSENQAVRRLATQFVKTIPELTESLGQIRALSVQVASQHQISADKKLQLLYTLSRIEERIVGLDDNFPDTSLTSLKAFLLTIKTGTENQGLSQQNPDHLFKDATLVIDELFTFINSGFTRIQDQLQGR